MSEAKSASARVANTTTPNASTGQGANSNGPSVVAAEPTKAPEAHTDYGPPVPGPFKQVVAGSEYTCALTEVGRTRCWGNDRWGQASPAESRFVRIAAGFDYACGILDNGGVRCWGAARLYASPGEGRFTDLSIGHDLACAIDTAGALVCWGDQQWTQHETEPFVQVAADSGCGVQQSGDVHCYRGDDRAVSPQWLGSLRPSEVAGDLVGLNSNLELRSPGCVLTSDHRAVCHEMNGQAPPRQELHALTVEHAYACALDVEGAIRCWGDTGSPGAHPPLGQFIQVSAGRTHACGLLADHSVQCWGDNRAGQLAPPPQGPSLVDAEGYQIVERDEEGRLFYWDVASGPPTTLEARRKALLFPDRYGIIDARTAACCAYGIGPDGTLVSTNPDSKMAVPHGTFVKLAVGGEVHVVDEVSCSWHLCAIDSTGRVACTGQTATSAASPPSAPFRDIVAGNRHTCGIELDGTLLCWGDGYNRLDRERLQYPPGPFEQVSIGESHSCGLHADGTVACWQSSVPRQFAPAEKNLGETAPDGHRFKQISAGARHNCGIAMNDHLYCWGDNEHGQLKAPSGSFIQVVSADDHSCAMRPGGKVQCWGKLRPEQPKPPMRMLKAEIRGSLSKEVIRRTVQLHLNEVRYCYEQGLHARPDLQGRVAVRFIIGASGAVTTATPAGSNVGVRDVENCIAAAVARWTFPAPKGGGHVVVTYPFMAQQADG